MFKITPLTREKTPKLLAACNENLILLQANVLEISRGYANVEQTTNAIDVALDCISEWVANLNATKLQFSMEYNCNGLISDSTEVCYCTMAMEHLKEVLEDIKKDPLLYDLRYRKEIVANKETIDKRYYSDSSKGHKRPPQYWCFSYPGRILEEDDIYAKMSEANVDKAVTADVDIRYAYLENKKNGQITPIYSTCGRAFYHNGASISTVKAMFPGADVYMGKAAQEFYNHHIKEYYGPDYICKAKLWDYSFYD